MHKKIAYIIFLNVVVFAANTFTQWTHISSSPTYLIRDIVESDGILYLAHSSYGIYKSTDSSVTWQQINNGLNTNQAKSVSQILVSGDTLYAATVDGIYKSVNSGDVWTKKSNGITIGPGANYEFCESIFEYGGSLFTGAHNGIYRSTDGAENWILTNISGSHIQAKNFTYHNGFLFAARENINIPSGYKSTNDGFIWEALPSNPLFSTITFYSESGKLWAGTIHGVWLSTDNGLNWENRSNGLSPDPYSSSIIRINDYLITSLKFGGSGMFRTSDHGLNWENWGEGLPFLNSIEKLVVFNDKILVATSDGLWQRDTSLVITTTGDESDLAQEFKLFQNYPNPFNPETNIRYTISRLQFVSLKVYDILGNEIAELVNEEKPAGVYEVVFSAKSGSASGGDAYRLSSGMYLYKLQTGSFVETKKMILLR